MRKQANIIITGRVQGVFFRASAKEKALELGIAGWIKNTSDGGVALVAQGKEEQLKAFLQWCKKGPPRAEVLHVDIQSQKTLEEFKGFRITG
ncbi:MAG: acylphosphatase [Patescibacteria group bacterium]